MRLVVGAAFVGHGTQKLFGWFGAYGPQGTGGFFGSKGFRAPVLMARGFATPLACLLLATVMINAIGSASARVAGGLNAGPLTHS